MRKRIYEIIETSKDNDKISSLYDAIMLFAILRMYFSIQILLQPHFLLSIIY